MTKIYSPTYPANWTEEERKAAEDALTKVERNALLQELETPPDFWAWAMRQWRFTGDACAKSHNAKCPLFITPEQDALNTNWKDLLSHRVWCNPGFSNVGPWHHEAYVHAMDDVRNLAVVAGIPGASAKWFEFACQNASEILYLSPRIQYLCPWPLKQITNPRESVLYVYRRKVGNQPATHIRVEWE